MHAIKSAAEAKTQRIGLAVTIALHVVVVAALLSYAPVRQAMLDAAPIMVDYIVPPVVETAPEPPKLLPVRQKPTPQQPVEPAPLLAITREAPAVYETPVQDVIKPLPPIQVGPPPAPPAPALPTTPPNFNAAYLDNPPPAYPPLSRRSGEQGRVLLRVHVSASGAADTVELRTSSGSPRLDNVAVETVKRWRFVPARQGDQPVAAWVLVPINFTLEN
ncbi:MAG: energy transducer TonB [Casimicrobiaceae bacterium]